MVLPKGVEKHSLELSFPSVFWVTIFKSLHSLNPTPLLEFP